MPLKPFHFFAALMLCLIFSQPSLGLPAAATELTVTNDVTFESIAEAGRQRLDGFGGVSYPNVYAVMASRPRSNQNETLSATSFTQVRVWVKNGDPNTVLETEGRPLANGTLSWIEPRIRQRNFRLQPISLTDLAAECPLTEALSRIESRGYRTDWDHANIFKEGDVGSPQTEIVWSFRHQKGPIVEYLRYGIQSGDIDHEIRDQRDIRLTGTDLSDSSNSTWTDISDSLDADDTNTSELRGNALAGTT